MSAHRRDSLSHQAFLYESSDELVAELAPFIREGLERGDKVFAATTRPNVDALREELGDAADGVELEDTAEWCARPYDRLQAFRKMVAELPQGGRLRAMGEPLWLGSDAVVRQWARYESVINVALADAPMQFICLYDGSALPDRILDYAGRTHPEALNGAGPLPSGSFVEPQDFVAGTPPAPPPGSLELSLDATAFRRQLAGFALDAGLDARRVEDFMLAGHEVAVNALRHGTPPLRAHAWIADGELICRIADSGPGLANPLAGWLPPDYLTTGGWGLSMARQLCDALDIASGESGTVVSLHISLERRGLSAPDCG